MRLCLTWRRVDKYGLDTAVEVHSPSHLQLMFVNGDNDAFVVIAMMVMRL